ncbi:unnamed protein product [Effrenium voratum]|uniref:3'-5' exonuclease domain-containing protein n=1 Tax=Effrenium voratum TaxID=2562239 RepID=A0AA36JCN3_9DINO|nr:unnamed protein product [Effrenium voratum]
MQLASWPQGLAHQTRAPAQPWRPRRHLPRQPPASASAASAASAAVSARVALRGQRRSRETERDEADDAEDTEAEDAWEGFGTPRALDKEALLQEFVSHQRVLVDTEFEEQKRIIETRLKEWPLERLVEEGLSLGPARAEKVGSFFGDALVRFKAEREQLQEASPGDILLVSKVTSNPLLPDALKAQVVNVTGEHMDCVMEYAPANMELRLDKGINKLDHERAQSVLKDLGAGDLATPICELWKVFLSAKASHALPHAGSGEVGKASSGSPASPKDELEKLNQLEEWNLRLPEDLPLDASQTEAVQFLEDQRVAMVQGPPGCGKTRTACALLKAASQQGKRCLAVADSNTAADQLLRGLLGCGVEALRLGSPAAVSAELRGATLRAQPGSKRDEKLKSKLVKKISAIEERMGQLEETVNQDRQRLRQGCETFDGRIFQVPSEAEHAEGLAWLAGKLRRGEAVAWDMEWIPDSRRSQNPVELLQFADDDTALLVKMGGKRQLPKVVRELLTSSDCIKVTVGQDDRDKVEQSFELTAANVVDLQSLAQEKGLGSSLGLQKMAQLFGMKMFKDHTITMSNWAGQLSKEQVQYAAEDAYFTYQIYDQLSLFDVHGSDEIETDEAQDIFRQMKRLRNQRLQLKRQLNKVNQHICREIVKKAEVVVSTLCTANSWMWRQELFDVVLLDEAGQATVPHGLMGFRKLQEGGRLVLIGDPMQLPPVCVSQMAAHRGLSTSIFDFLLDCGLKPKMLSIQYRMQPLISLWPSETFYKGRLRDGIMADTARFRSLPWLRQPIAFVDVAGQEELGGTSYFNLRECNAVRETVARLLEELDPEDIGVICPYRSQVLRLKRDLCVEVQSVDGFQGREKKVIIFSCVRAHNEPRGGIGFLSDFRRLNVAITRAQRALIVFGNRKTLQRHFMWANWLHFVGHHDSRFTWPHLLPQANLSAYTFKFLQRSWERRSPSPIEQRRESRNKANAAQKLRRARMNRRWKWAFAAPGRRMRLETRREPAPSRPWDL